MRVAGLVCLVLIGCDAPSVPPTPTLVVRRATLDTSLVVSTSAEPGLATLTLEVEMSDGAVLSVQAREERLLPAGLDASRSGPETFTIELPAQGADGARLRLFARACMPDEPTTCAEVPLEPRLNWISWDVPPGEVIPLSDRETLVVGERRRVDALAVTVAERIPGMPMVSDVRPRWSSDDPSVAEVSPEGEVVARAPGLTVLRAQASGANGATVDVEVTEGSPGPPTGSVLVSTLPARGGADATITSAVVPTMGDEVIFDDDGNPTALLLLARVAMGGVNFSLFTLVLAEWTGSGFGHRVLSAPWQRVVGTTMSASSDALRVAWTSQSGFLHPAALSAGLLWVAERPIHGGGDFETRRIEARRSDDPLVDPPWDLSLATTTHLSPVMRAAPEGGAVLAFSVLSRTTDECFFAVRQLHLGGPRADAVGSLGRTILVRRAYDPDVGRCTEAESVGVYQMALLPAAAGADPDYVLSVGNEVDRYRAQRLAAARAYAPEVIFEERYDDHRGFRRPVDMAVARDGTLALRGWVPDPRMPLDYLPRLELRRPEDPAPLVVGLHALDAALPVLFSSGSDHVFLADYLSPVIRISAYDAFEIDAIEELSAGPRERTLAEVAGYGEGPDAPGLLVLRPRPDGSGRYDLYFESTPSPTHRAEPRAAWASPNGSRLGGGPLSDLPRQATPLPDGRLLLARVPRDGSDPGHVILSPDGRSEDVSLTGDLTFDLHTAAHAGQLLVVTSDALGASRAYLTTDGRSFRLLTSFAADGSIEDVVVTEDGAWWLLLAAPSPRVPEGPALETVSLLRAASLTAGEAPSEVWRGPGEASFPDQWVCHEADTPVARGRPSLRMFADGAEILLLACTLGAESSAVISAFRIQDDGTWSHTVRPLGGRRTIDVFRAQRLPGGRLVSWWDEDYTVGNLMGLVSDDDLASWSLHEIEEPERRDMLVPLADGRLVRISEGVPVAAVGVQYGTQVTSGTVRFATTSDGVTWTPLREARPGSGRIQAVQAAYGSSDGRLVLVAGANSSWAPVGIDPGYWEPAAFEGELPLPFMEWSVTSVAVP